MGKAGSDLHSPAFFFCSFLPFYCYIVNHISILILTFAVDLVLQLNIFQVYWQLFCYGFPSHLLVDVSSK